MKSVLFFLCALVVCLIYFWGLDMALMGLQGLDVGWNLFPAK